MAFSYKLVLTGYGRECETCGAIMCPVRSMGQSSAEAMGSPSLDSISAYCLDKSLNLNSLIFAAYLLVMMTPMITVPNSIPLHSRLLYDVN